jgi:two-component system cell cycle response regulator DivK
MSKGSILYIEDNFDNRILIKRVLEAEGYTVIEADNGRTGLELARANKPDLILMDINLPDVDGYECTTRLRQMDGMSQIPIIALTANVMTGDHEKALAAGCDDYIPKPVDIDQLPAQVAQHIKPRLAEPDSEGIARN